MNCNVIGLNGGHCRIKLSLSHPPFQFIKKIVRFVGLFNDYSSNNLFVERVEVFVEPVYGYYCLDIERYLVIRLVDVCIPLEEKPHHLYFTAKQRCM